MTHLKALSIKFVIFFTVGLIILGGIYQVTLGDIFMISLLLTITAYLMGDLVLLPKMGNTAALFSDFGLSYFGMIIFGVIFIEQATALGISAFLMAILVTLGEVYFHSFMYSHVLHNQKNGKFVIHPRLQFVTEFAEEVDMVNLKDTNGRADHHKSPEN
ncbi:YndM family protein [Evansella tamaricis]|uniref:YndM family protein n=1 Tax=Evansella tamaricis TaxID=2069301 RepID=A0ABS6JJS8_9BACI|nr:YndM family protein [Evansella tamaricis]MBU9713942.1 YndM family protein [Evansella tamaricis]